MKRIVNSALPWTIGCAWLAAILCGFWVWERYDTTAGQTRASAIDQSIPGRWQLTVFVHPHCPCARATIAELVELLRDAPDLKVQVVFVSPPGAAAGWEQGALWDAVLRIAAVELSIDALGTQSRAFGAATSGHAVLTNPAGQVVFSGGLTRARGRSGESAGRGAVRDWVAGREAIKAAPVFGCPLFDVDD